MALMKAITGRVRFPFARILDMIREPLWHNERE